MSSGNDYNWEMTGPPSAAEAVSNPEAAQSWNEYVQSGGGGPQAQEIAPASYEQQVETARSWGVPEDQIASIVGTPESVAANNRAEAARQNELYGFTPTWASDYGYTAPPPTWLRPSDYVSQGFAAPYTKEQISSTIDPSWIRQMAGQTYASVKGPGDLSGGEYLIDPKTGKFIFDKSGNPIGVTYPQSHGFDDWVTTPLGGLALTFGAPLLAAGATYALPYLAGEAALGAGAAAEGAGAAGAAGAGAGAGAGAAGAAGTAAATEATGLGGATLNSILAGAGKGALTGAAMGGISSGIQGGDIGQGILRGGLTGAVGGGIGGGLGGGPLANIIGGTGAGAAGAALSGGNIGRGALMGGASGLLNYGTSQIPGLQGTPGQFGLGDIARGAITGGTLSSVMGGNFGKGALGGIGGAYLSSQISPYISNTYDKYFATPKTIDVTANQPVSSFYPEGSGLAGNAGYLQMPAAPTTTSGLSTQDIAQQYAQLPAEQQAAFDQWKEASYSNPAFQRIDPTSGATITGPSVKDMEAAIAVLTGSGNAMAADTTQAPTGEKISISDKGNLIPISANQRPEQLDPAIAKGMQEKDYRLATQEEIGKPVYVPVKGGSGIVWNPQTGAVLNDEANAWVIPNNPKPFVGDVSEIASEDAKKISPSFLPTKQSDMLAGELGEKGYIPGERYTELEIIDPKTDKPITADLPKSVTDQPDPKMATPTKELDPSKVDKENTAKVEKKNADGSAVVKNAITGEKSTVYLNGEADIGDNVQVTSIRTTSPTTDYQVSSQAGGTGEDQGTDKEKAAQALNEQIATQVAADNLIGEGEGAGGAGGGGGGGAGGGGGGGGAGGSGSRTGGGKPGGGTTAKLPTQQVPGKNVTINLPGMPNLSPGLARGKSDYQLAGQFHFATGGGVSSPTMTGVGGTSMGQSPLDKYIATLSPGLVHGSDEDYHLPGYAQGGDVEGHNPEFFSEGGLGSLDNRYVKGKGDGTSDSIPAMLANGEFVIPADVVSSLGNGSNDSGAVLLDEFLKTIRKHKRAADARQLPPDSKGPLGYLLEAKKKVNK